MQFLGVNTRNFSTEKIIRVIFRISEALFQNFFVRVIILVIFKITRVFFEKWDFLSPPFFFLFTRPGGTVRRFKAARARGARPAPLAHAGRLRAVQGGVLGDWRQRFMGAVASDGRPWGTTVRYGRILRHGDGQHSEAARTAAPSGAGQEALQAVPAAAHYFAPPFPLFSLGYVVAGAYRAEPCASNADFGRLGP